MQFSRIRIDCPAPVGFRVWCALRRSRLGRWSYRRRWRRSGAAFLLSYPKAGRTWVRLLLGKVLADHFGLDASFDDILALDHLHDLYPHVPLIEPRHDDYPQLKTPDELVARKDEYRHSRVILLVRDPRDLAVSAYFQMTRRRGKFSGSLGDFLRGPRGGIDTVIRFHNIWAACRNEPAAFLLVRYEDLRVDTARELRRMVDSLGLRKVGDDVLAAAVEYASFSNMRRQETSRDGSGPNRLDGGTAGDAESLKTRKGKVGGFAEYMTPEDAAWLTRRLEQELDPMYGYPYASDRPAPGVV
ncbi:MAG: sulfotransferase domain-containing protein [Lentisphaeria bacterium]|nr:sulfotransferase domain-containing protein [Lentisphaeria bacterium]